VKSPFRRRKRPKGRPVKGGRPAKPKAAEPEPIDWPQEGTGRSSLMNAIRGDADSGAGFGAGMFQDLHAAFSGSKRIQIEQQEAEKMRRHDDHQQAGTPNRADLDSGKIRIRRPENGEDGTPATG
jgi:hypothetical protein